MHIMEGYLPWYWCVIWFAIAMPIVIWGVSKVIKIVKENPDQKMLVALSGAFIFLLSSLKLPSVTGSSSHPTGTALSAVLYGVACTSFLSLIVLLFQALLLAHGGLTTLGANCFSMGIAGPALGFSVWILLRKVMTQKKHIPIVMLISAFGANLFTYVVTSIQLTLAHGMSDPINSLITFMTTFSVTQIPLAIIEGILFAMFAQYLLVSRPQVFDVSSGENYGKSKKEVQDNVMEA